ncbi:sec tRNA synthase [Entophlyctis helioformis]|nr:sec tRNA synthase [Entophlyctis helioformis]
MNDARNLELAAELLRKDSYVRLAQQNYAKKVALVRHVLSQRRMPETGWTDEEIQAVLAELASMDSNNYQGSVGVGEREGRIFSSLVAARHLYLSHGVGRSGDIAEVQPKAPGSSLIHRICNALALDALRLAGASKTLASAALVLPVATGMTASLVFAALRQQRPTAKYIIWPRIDQKSCLKCMATSGFVPVVIENRLDGDSIVTDLDAIKTAITDLGPASVLCVFSTTSCFAPRVPSDVCGIAAICAALDVPHVVNNAYGVQSARIMSMLSATVGGRKTPAKRQGRIDAFIQSTDKNFMVPVGGCVVAGPNSSLIDAVGQVYPGRASMAPILDLMITLLAMGSTTWAKLLKTRRENYVYFKERMTEWCLERGLRILDTPANDISMAIALPDLAGDGAHSARSSGWTKFGSMLFHRFVSGARVVQVQPSGPKKTIQGIEFANYGSHIDNYPHSYFNVAAAIGMERTEIDVFIERLTAAWSKFLARPTDAMDMAG